MAEGDLESQQFVKEELDGLCLHNEDYEHIGDCHDCLTDLNEINQELLEKFTFFRHHSESPGNDSSPERHEFEELLPFGLKTNALHGRLSTISQIMQYPTCDWNEHASQVLNALKVNAYIVQPNYFLSANLHCTIPVSELNMDAIFQYINHQTDTDPPSKSWSVFKHKFDVLLDAFDFEGCKNLADEMFQRWMELTILSGRLSALGRTAGYSNVVRRSIELMRVGMKSGKVVENLSLEYIFALFEFFKHATVSADFGLYIRSQLQMSLSFDDIGQKPVILDFHATCHDSPYLVGEFKKFKEAESTANQDNQRSETLNELSKELEKKLNIGCNHHDNPSGPNDPKENACNSGSANNENSEESCGYRKISTVELHKVSRYLPQLLGGMLASMSQHGGYHLIASLQTIADQKRSYNVQLGFSVEGFKLRFVRLVLCRNKTSDVEPTVDDIKKPDVKCHVFITKEFNLFHKQHLELFFKYLFVFASISEI